MDFADGLKGLAFLLWLVVAGLFILAINRARRGQAFRATSTTIVVMTLVAGLVTIISFGVVFIEPEERGVVISAVSPMGYREAPLSPGLRLIVPGMERVQTYPVSRQTYTMARAENEGPTPGDDSIVARTADGQEVFVDASVIYQINPSEVVKVHIAWQNRYPNDLVRPLARGVIRDAISQYGVEEVYSTQRDQLSERIETNLSEKLEENGLLLVGFILRNITFSPEYAASVEQKQIAEQRAQQAAFTVEQRRQEAEQARQVAQGQADAAVIGAQGAAEARLIEARAEAEALKMIADALQDNPELLTYNYIDKLAPGIQVMLVPNNTPYLLPLPEFGPGVAGVEQAPAAPTSEPPEIAPTPEPTATP